MTSILKDNKGSIYHFQTCKYCTDYKGRPKPMFPEDMNHARKIKTVDICAGIARLKGC
jgi:hypothetical protein